MTFKHSKNTVSINSLTGSFLNGNSCNLVCVEILDVKFSLNHRFLSSLLLLLLLSCFSRVRLCATLETAAHQVPPSLEFCRQKHWSGLPLPLLLSSHNSLLSNARESLFYFSEGFQKPKSNYIFLKFLFPHFSPVVTSDAF